MIKSDTYRLARVLATNPMGILTLSSSDLRKLLLENNGYIYAQGRPKDIKSKRIGPGVYKVWLENEK